MVLIVLLNTAVHIQTTPKFLDLSICQPHGLHSTCLLQLCPRNIYTNICLTSKEILTDSDDRACLASANILAKGCANHKLLHISEVRRCRSSFAFSSLKDNYPSIESAFLCSTHAQQSFNPCSLTLSLHIHLATLVTPGHSQSPLLSLPDS